MDQRRKELKIKKYRGRRLQLRKEFIDERTTVEDLEQNLSDHNKKTLDFQRFKNYIQAKNAMRT